MDISIIVPVYNVEKYLIRCLKSIFNQQFSGNFEVIAVDDCSNDNSLELLYNYQKSESRLKIIKHSKNYKQSIARATGMKAAKGAYIMHVDSDDWLVQNTLEKLFYKLRETNADVIVFNYSREDSKGNNSLVKKIKKEQITFNKIEVQEHFFGASVNKIVKRELTLNMISGEIGVNTTEDLLYATEILLRAEKICLVPDSYYIYFENTNSITNTINPEDYLRNQVLILNQIQKIFFRYNSNLKLTNNILNYIEKWIYLELAKSHFWNIDKRYANEIVLKEFEKIAIIDKFRYCKFKMSLKNRFVCLLFVTKNFGVKTSVWIIKRSFS